MPLAKRDGLPRVGQGSLTDRATSALLDAILEGRFEERRLPPEPELAVLLGVSRTTVRSALMSLERLGVITRVPGRGTVVRSHVGRQAIILQRLIGFRSLLEENHQDVRVQQTYWLDDRPSSRATGVLGLREDESVIRSNKLFTADGQPAIRIRDEIPLSQCSKADQEKFRALGEVALPDSIFEFSKTWPGGEIEHTLIELVPGASPGAKQGGLDLPVGTPTISMIETHYSLDGTALALSEVDVNDALVRFHIVRHN